MISLDFLDRKPSWKYSFYFIIFLGLIVKFSLFRFQYVDYGFYLSVWMREIEELGLAGSLKDGSFNYTPMYIYILGLLTKIDIYSLYTVKIVSMIFEYLLAFFIGRLIFLYTKQKYAVLLALTVVPILPTVILNSSFMSQCDAIYSCFVIASLYYLFSQKKIAAMILLGIAFSFKLQTVFVLPFYFIYMLRGNIKWYYFLIVPCIYVISILPAWVSGRPFIDLLTVYVSQSSYNVELVKNVPNIYQWLPFSDLVKYGALGIICILSIIGCIYLTKKKYVFNLELWYQLIFLGFVVYPFFLPGMLERYMYLADVWTLVVVSISFRNLFPAFGILFVSFYSYVRTLYIFSFSPQSIYPTRVFAIFEFIPWGIVSVLYLLVVLYVLFRFIHLLKVSSITQ